MGDGDWALLLVEQFSLRWSSVRREGIRWWFLESVGRWVALCGPAGRWGLANRCLDICGPVGLGLQKTSPSESPRATMSAGRGILPKVV